MNARDDYAIAVVLACLIFGLSKHPVVAAMLEACDTVERFEEGCRQPWFQQELGLMMLKVRDAALTPVGGGDERG